MSYHVYILHALGIDAYYVGYTGGSLTKRLRKHNTNHKGFTGRSNSWAFVYLQMFETKTQAIEREQDIKRQKSRKYIVKLINSAG